jgi:D-glycero-D-manno-heptose 1,7-bisphosphate phosphatase
MNKAVFIDRDGVINELINRDGGKYSPRLVKDFHMFPFVPGAMKQIRDAGYLVVIVTNQPDISRGFLKQEVLDEMHQILRTLCQVDAIYVCPHDNSDACLCRKPLPGMLLEAASDFSIDLNSSWMIGDRDSDIQAGQKAGCSTIMIGTQQLRNNQQWDLDTQIAGDLSSVFSIIDPKSGK